MKISKLKPDKEKPISDPIQKQSRPKEKGIVIGEINYSDINRPRTRSQAKSETEPKNKLGKIVTYLMMSYLTDLFSVQK